MMFTEPCCVLFCLICHTKILTSILVYLVVFSNEQTKGKVTKEYYLTQNQGNLCPSKPRGDIQVLPQCSATSQDQITSLFLCTENHYFHLENMVNVDC